MAIFQLRKGKAGKFGKVKDIFICFVLLGGIYFIYTSVKETLATPLERGPNNGFDLSNITIPVDEVLGGGPPRDGIPAIMDPKFTSIEKSTLLGDSDIVISFSHNGETKAYPLKIIVRHEIVNDIVGGKPVLITYCPLCGTSMVFERVYNGVTHTYGVSGLLYNSDVLLYDHQTDSLWSQLKMEAVSGPKVGQKLQWLPSSEMTWKSWKTEYPKGMIQSFDTGFKLNYIRPSPYQSYFKSSRTMFPVPYTRQEISKKDWVIGVEVSGVYKAYSYDMLLNRDGKDILDEVGGAMIKIIFNPESKKVTVFNNKSNVQIPHVKLYWFAWQAFYPDTELYKD